MPRITSSIFILVLFFLTACNNSEKHLFEKNFPFPIVLDTIRVDSFLNHYNNKNPKYLSEGDYYFTYIGNYEDTIYTSLVIFGNPFLGDLEKEDPKEMNEYSKQLLSFQKYYLEDGEERNYKGIGRNFEIRVDTSKRITGFYPVMITNKSSDTCFIGSQNQIPLIMEAKNKQGKWKPIQSQYIVGCGTGVGHVFLPPGQIAITLAPIFKGDYKTQLRLKCGENYSNTFTGKIYYQQFEYQLRAPYPL